MSSQRIQIPFAFSYPSGTVYVATASGGAVTTQADVLEPVVGGTVTVTNRDTGNAATVWQAETGTSTYASVVTDSGGNVPGWLDPGSYKIVAAPQGTFAGATINWEAVRGGAVTNLAPNSVGTSQIQDGAVTLSKLAAAVAQALVQTGTVFDFAGSSAPTGYALCDGSGHQPSDADWTKWSSLFSVLGTTYGVFGTGGFKLPDTRGRFTLGAGSAVTGYTSPGNSGGALGHTHGLDALSLSANISSAPVTVQVPGLSVPQNTFHMPLGVSGGVQLGITLQQFSSGTATRYNLIFAGGQGGPTFPTQSAFQINVANGDYANYAVGSVGTFSGWALVGQTEGNPAFVTQGATAQGTVGGSSVSGNLHTNQVTKTADPPFLTVNKIIKL